MPRTALGASAKSEILSVRVTKTEKEILKGHVGDISKWLRSHVYKTLDEAKKAAKK